MYRYDDKKRKILTELKRSKKKRAVEYKGGKCERCLGVFHPCVYDFHHKDPNEKDGRLSVLLNRSWDRAVVELDKCEMLCANCHRLEHCQYV